MSSSVTKFAVRAIQGMNRGNEADPYGKATPSFAAVPFRLEIQDEHGDANHPYVFLANWLCCAAWKAGRPRHVDEPCIPGPKSRM